jgi:hypothetical protein
MVSRKLVLLIVVSQVIIALLVIAFVGLFPGLAVQQARAGSVRYYSLLAETMQPVTSNIVYDNTSAFLTTISPATAYYIGQLDLPDNSRIVETTCFAVDSDPSREIYYRLYRYNLFENPVWSAVTDFTYSGLPFDGGKIEMGAVIDADMAVVDNARYSYGIFLALPPAAMGQLGVLRCIVGTIYLNNLPMVTSD